MEILNDDKDDELEVIIMAMMKKFDKDFVKRTLDILEECSQYTEYDVTLLLNCLLALVTLPIEKNKIKKNNIQDADIIKFQNDCVDKMKELENLMDTDNSKNDEKFFFNNIRNAIAHLHIELEESLYNGQIENVILRNALNDKEFHDKKYNLQINISVDNLKIFAKYVANEYLNRFF